MLSKKDTFNLLTSNRYVISKNKATFLVGMSMKIKKGKQLTTSQLQ